MSCSAYHLLGPFGQAAGLYVLQRVVTARVALSVVVRRHPEALGRKAGALEGGAARQPQQQLRVGRYQLVRRRVPCVRTQKPTSLNAARFQCSRDPPRKLHDHIVMALVKLHG